MDPSTHSDISSSDLYDSIHAHELAKQYLQRQHLLDSIWQLGSLFVDYVVVVHHGMVVIWQGQHCCQSVSYHFTHFFLMATKEYQHS